MATRGIVLPIGYDITDAQKALKDLKKHRKKRQRIHTPKKGKKLTGN